MKGDAKVIALLNDILTAELTAINQYFLHAELCEHWGFERLHHRLRKESIEEMRHAEKLVHRILFLEGLPNLQKLNKVGVGQTVAEQFQLDLAVELEAVKRLNDAIEACRAVGDGGTREVLEHILREEEGHVDWTETQLEAMKTVGEQNYLAEQLKKEE
ncbi:MAG: bacterioferritin [Myxococcales bacterium]|nr:bacterioferritin [Myxococcales bacterium]